jgi:hypothetical protein
MRSTWFQRNFQEEDHGNVCLCHQTRRSQVGERQSPGIHKTIAPESECDDKISVQIITTPKKKIIKELCKISSDISDVIAEELEYQKKLKWLKDHGDLTGEGGNNPGDKAPSNEASSTLCTTVESITSSSICFEYFGSTSTLLRLSKKSREEQIWWLMIGYFVTIKGNKDSNNWKRMSIFLDWGCAATLINHNLIKSLDTTKENIT